MSVAAAAIGDIPIAAQARSELLRKPPTRRTTIAERDVREVVPFSFKTTTPEA